jgi:hypothetical protein
MRIGARADATSCSDADTRCMVARDVEMLGRRLHELNERSLADLGLAGVAFGLALAATQLRRDLTIPLLIGALVLTGMGLVAFVRRQLLVEDAAVDRDAYALAAVGSYARRLAGRDNRRMEAAQIRRLLALSGDYAPSRVKGSRAQLRRLVRKLEREDLELDPVCAVTLARLLQDSALPADEFRSRLTQVEAGFRSARVRR